MQHPQPVHPLCSASSLDASTFHVFPPKDPRSQFRSTAITPSREYLKLFGQLLLLLVSLQITSLRQQHLEEGLRVPEASHADNLKLSLHLRRKFRGVHLPELVRLDTLLLLMLELTPQEYALGHATHCGLYTLSLDRQRRKRRPV